MCVVAFVVAIVSYSAGSADEWRCEDLIPGKMYHYKVQVRTPTALGMLLIARLRPSTIRALANGAISCEFAPSARVSWKMMTSSP